MMLTVTCYDCGEMYSLRGWIEKEDLRGTQFEEKIDTITDAELSELEEKGLIHDEMDVFEKNPCCRYCGSKNVTWLGTPQKKMNRRKLK